MEEMIGQMESTYSEIDRNLREYSRLMDLPDADSHARARACRAEADRLTVVARGIVSRLCAGVAR